MKRNNLFFVLIALLVCFVTSLKAQSDLSLLDYNAFLDNVKNEHPIAKKAKNISTIGKQQQRSAQGNFDPSLQLNLENKFNAGKNYYTVLNGELKQGIFTGQSLRAGYELGQGDFIDPQNQTPSNGLAYVGIDFSLLQGLMIDKRRFEVLKSKHYNNMLQNESAANLNDLLLLASESYVDWLHDYTLVEINQRYTDAANQRFKALISLSQIGERPYIDTVESGILMQTRLIDFGTSKMQLNKSQFFLFNFIWKNNANLKSNTIKPNISLNQLEENCLQKFLKAKSNLQTQNPSLLYYANKTKLLQLEKRYRAELIKPKLDLKYNLLNIGNGTNVFYNNNYKWGFGFAMPLFLRTSIHDYRIAGLQLQNNQFEMENKRAEIDNKLISATNNVLVIADQIQTAKRNVQFSKMLLEAEKTKFDNNESSLFLLNTRESKVLDSEIKLIELQTKFIFNYLSYAYLIGDLNYSIEP